MGPKDGDVVVWLLSLVAEQDISATIGQIAMTFGLDIYDLKLLTPPELFFTTIRPKFPDVHIC